MRLETGVPRPVILLVVASVVVSLVVALAWTRSGSTDPVDAAALASESAPIPVAPSPTSAQPTPTDPRPPTVDDREIADAIPAREHRSSRFGYAVTVPGDWSFTPAVASREGADPSSSHPVGGWRGQPVKEADVFRDPDLDDRPVFWIRGFAVADGTTADALTAKLPVRIDTLETRCRFTKGEETLMFGRPETSWVPISIDGHDATLRRLCGYADAIVVVDGLAYVVSMWTGISREADLEAFREVTDTIRFVAPSPAPSPTVPIPATPTSPVDATFASSAYAYEISYPKAWRVIPATSTWSGSGSWTSSPAADIFKPVGEDLPFLSVVAFDVPGAEPIDDFIDRSLPQRAEVRVEANGLEYCVFRTARGSMMIGGLGETHWYDYRMGAHDIRLRDSCGYVDAVLAAGRRIWIVSFATEPMRNADRIVFNASVASLVLDPDAPLGTP